jgi:hypothetical protein
VAARATKLRGQMVAFKATMDPFSGAYLTMQRVFLLRFWFTVNDYCFSFSFSLSF